MFDVLVGISKRSVLVGKRTWLCILRVSLLNVNTITISHVSELRVTRNRLRVLTGSLRSID